MDKLNYKKENDFDGGEEVFSKVVRAGSRTYFFDVKSTKTNDYYLTITESRKKPGRDGNMIFEKHKLFLYKEDFMKFVNGLEEVIAYIKKEKPGSFEQHPEGITHTVSIEEFDKL